MNKKSAAFITAASPIDRIEDGRYIKTHTGYIGAIKVPGTDIFGFKDSDRENTMRAFGNAVSVVDIPTKYVFIGCKPDYGVQKANIARHEIRQKHPYRKKLLERQRAWLEYYEKNEETRLSFIMFFAPEKSSVADAMNKYIGCLSQALITASVCSENDYKQIYKTLLRGGNE